MDVLLHIVPTAQSLSHRIGFYYYIRSRISKINERNTAPRTRYGPEKNTIHYPITDYCCNFFRTDNIDLIRSMTDNDVNDCNDNTISYDSFIINDNILSWYVIMIKITQTF